MTRPARRLPQAGFTLVELMVSMAIGLLIVLALITLLINVNRNNSEMSKTNRVIENGRFALQLLQADISHAGFWGGYVPQFDDLTATAVPTDYPTSVPDPCLAYTSWNVSPYTDATMAPPVSHKKNLIGIVVQGYEIPAVVPSPTLSVCANRVTRPKGNTDVLVVRHAERAANCNPAKTGCPLPSADELYFQMEQCGDAAPATPYLLEPFQVAGDLTLFRLQNRSCTSLTTVAPAATTTTAATQAERRKFVSNLYYVRRFSVDDGDNIPTLMRSQFSAETVAGVPVLQHQAADALIEGIEGFRVEYGIDNVSDSGVAVNFTAAINWVDTTNLTSPRNRGDGIPDGNYIRCTTATPCTAAQLVNVVAVKLYVLVRSEQKTPGYTDSKTYNLGSTSLGPFNDAYKRHLFTQTVRLTNVSSRRETP